MNTIYLIISILVGIVTEHHLLLKEVNMVRESGCQCGEEYYEPVKPLEWNSALYQTAKMHAEDMENDVYFSHYDDAGKDVGDRAYKLYDWQIIGENLAVGFKSNLEVMHAWLASDEHCQMIMEPIVAEMGASRVGYYWVINFGIKESYAKN